MGFDALLERRTVRHAGRTMNGTGSRRPERLAGWVITAEAAAAYQTQGWPLRWRLTRTRWRSCRVRLARPLRPRAWVNSPGVFNAQAGQRASDLRGMPAIRIAIR